MLSNQEIARQLCTRRRSALFLLLSTCIIVLSAVIALLYQHRQPTQADSPYVVGPPTLPAAMVNRILAETPMAGTGWVIEEASRNTNIDDAFALGVWWSETNDGAAGVGLDYRNPGGVRSSASYAVGGGGYTIYPSYATAIDDWFNIVESRYINRGLTSVYTIAHPYVGTSGATSWANKVYNLMMRYHTMAPAPTLIPTPAPTPSPTPQPRDWEHEQPATIIYPKYVQQTGSVMTPSKKIVPAATISPVLSAKSEDIVVGIGLLTSSLLIGLGAMLRRKSSQQPFSASLPSTMSLAKENSNSLALAANSAPIFDQYAGSLLVAKLAPLETIAEPATAPLLTVSGGGLLTRYGNAEISPRRIPLVVAVQTEQLSSSDEEKSAISAIFGSQDDAGPRTTAGLACIRPGMCLPARKQLELVTTGNMPEEKQSGLLGRYGDSIH